MSFLGGLKSLWYDLPDAGWTNAPVILATNNSSSIFNSTAFCKGVFASANMESNFSAWGMVAGKPSKMKPDLHSELDSNSDLIMLTMISSETSPPWSIIFFASTPNAVLAATWARNISPVAKWHAQNFSFKLGAWVPFPAPGGPINTMRMDAGTSGTSPAFLSRWWILSCNLATVFFKSSTDMVSEKCSNQKLSECRKSWAATPPANLRAPMYVTKTLPGYGEKFDEKSTWLVKPADAGGSDPVILYLHGGGYFLQAMPEQIKSLISVYKLLDSEKQAKTSILLLDYSLVSYNHKLPTQMEELDRTYSQLVAAGRDNIVLLGDSAGGNLSIAFTQYIHQVKPHMVYPSKLILVSPWVGLTPQQDTHFFPGRSFYDNVHYDLINFKQFGGDSMKLFLDEDQLHKVPYFHWCISPTKTENWGDIPSYSSPKHDVFVILGEDESFRDDIVQWCSDALGISLGEFRYGASNNAVIENHEIVSKDKKDRANFYYYVEPWGIHDALFFMEDDVISHVKQGAKITDLDTTKYFGITRIVNYLNERL